MGRRSGDRCRARWAGVVILTVALVAGCGGDDDAGAPAAPAGAESTMSTTPPTTAPADQAEPADPGDPGITAPSTSLPEGSVEVPIDPALAEALPSLTVAEGLISDDETFDERLCTGDKAPAIPKSQARATYEVSPTELITIAAYDFSAGGGALYLADYAAAVQACAVEVGAIEGLGLPDAIGQAFELTTTRGSSAFIAMALRQDVIWILFQERTDGPVGLEEATLATYLRVLGA